jgi:predicted alpha/beta-hydrolase family hydrolase
VNAQQILTTEVAGRRILHSLINQDETPRGLLIMLPGRGYLNVHPLMHYLRKVAVTLGYDVLSVTYGFQSQLYAQEDVGGDLLEEIRQAADQVFDQRTYDRIVIAGKSMGTPLASLYGSELAGRFPETDIAHLMLTPIRGATQGVQQRRTLAVIGTADPAYEAARVQADAGNKWIEWLVLDDLNHGLEHESDWQDSIVKLGVILNACHAFLEGVP